MIANSGVRKRDVQVREKGARGTRNSSETLAGPEQDRLKRECAKLNPAEEQAMADEGLANEGDLWTPY